jgi:hypothetical protein
MSSSGFRFDPNTPAAKQLVAKVFGKVREIWDPTLADDSLAQYTVALLAKGSDRKKLFTSLKTLLGEDASNALLDWCVVRLADSQGGSWRDQMLACLSLHQPCSMR